MGICLSMVEWLHPPSSTSCCTGAPAPPLASPRRRGRRWPCTRPWQRGVRGSCTHLCQGQIEASQFIGKNINWVLCVTTSSITSNREFSYPLYFMHILNTSYSNLKSRSPMLVSQHVTTASEIRMRRFGGGNPALPLNFCTISARIRSILANYLHKGYFILTNTIQNVYFTFYNCIAQGIKYPLWRYDISRQTDKCIGTSSNVFYTMAPIVCPTLPKGMRQLWNSCTEEHKNTMSRGSLYSSA